MSMMTSGTIVTPLTPLQIKFHALLCMLRGVKIPVFGTFWLPDHYFKRFCLEIHSCCGFYGQKTCASDLVKNSVIWPRKGQELSNK